MKLSGSTHINAPRERAFAYLTDASFVAECAPGVQKLEVIEPGKKFKVLAGIGFGAVKATFDTNVEFVEKRADNYAKIKAAGKAPGSNVDATAELILSDAPEGGTTLNWEADVSIAGAIASVALRLLGSVTQKLSAQFFEKAKARIENQSEIAR
jgi:carbon monoxide dehydrogenase subunit G